MEQAADRLQLLDLHVVHGVLGCGGEPALQAAGNTAFDQASVQPAIIGGERLQSIEALHFRPQLERNAKTRQLAPPGLGQLRVGSGTAPGCHHDPALGTGLEESDCQPQPQDDAYQRTANHHQILSHALAQHC
jgi:hypothetical protein